MSQNFVTTCIDIITAPKKAFLAIQDKPTFVLPLLLIIGLNALTLAYYFSMVDFPWLMDQLVLQQGDLSIAEQNEMQEGLSFMTPLIMGAMSAAAMAVVTVLMASVYGLYISLSAKVTNDNLSFKHGVALFSWSGVVTVFAVLATFVNLALVENGKLVLEAINPLTLDSLFFHLEYGNSLKNLAGSVNPVQLWSYFLMALGYSVWTGKTLLRSALITLSPIALIYLVWIAIALG